MRYRRNGRTCPRHTSDGGCIAADGIPRLRLGGVATLEEGQLTRRCAEGKLLNLERCLALQPLEGKIGVGRTRWATHGRANEINAHPHATDCVAVLACLAIGAGRARGVLNEVQERQLVRELLDVRRLITEVLTLEPWIERLAREFARRRDVLYLGRGTSFPLALEGALKLKEISYKHAEGYAAGELKHGPIALIDETVPVVVIAPSVGAGESLGTATDGSNHGWKSPPQAALRRRCCGAMSAT